MQELLLKYYLITILLLVLFVYPAKAQYYGGSADGLDHSTSIQTSLNGDQINSQIIYRGGNGDGHHKKEYNGSIDGVSLTAIYTGGIDDGVAKNQFHGALDGTSILVLYQGGGGDGHHKIAFNGLVDGQSLSSMYSGGDGDGHVRMTFSSTLDNVPMEQLFMGGDGDGHHKNFESLIMSGELLEHLYTGGDGDGHHKTAFNGLVDGQSLSSMYSGGDGDGFSKHNVQYIFDFPGCTLVVNTDDDGFGSLRYAIDCASPGDTIDFSPLLLQDTISLTSASLTVAKDLYINGNPNAHLFVDASQVQRVLNIGLGNNVVVRGLKLIVGSEPIGGAIDNDGMLTLLDLDILDPNNLSSGAIHNDENGSITIEGIVRILKD